MAVSNSWNSFSTFPPVQHYTFSKNKNHWFDHLNHSIIFINFNNFNNLIIFINVTDGMDMNRTCNVLISVLSYLLYKAQFFGLEFFITSSHCYFTILPQQPIKAILMLHTELIKWLFGFWMGAMAWRVGWTPSVSETSHIIMLNLLECHLKSWQKWPVAMNCFHCSFSVSLCLCL